MSMSKKAKERLLRKKKKDKQKKIFFGVTGVIVTILVIGLIFFLKPDDDGSSIIDAGKAAVAANIDVNNEFTYVQLSDVNDENLHFYNYRSSNGKVVRYFIVKGSDSKYHASIDLCQKLHPARSGWKQDGPYIVCQDEWCQYPINAIGSEQPGCCWPVTLPFEIVGSQFHIRTEHLENAAQYF